MALEYALLQKNLPSLILKIRFTIRILKNKPETLEDNFRKKFGLVVQANQIEKLNDVIDHKKRL